MIEQYDPELFTVERATAVPSILGQAVLGYIRLGVTTSSWVTVPLATFTYGFDYTPDENKTLIIGSETATVSLSFRGEPDSIPLYPSDRVRVTYGSDTLMVGTVDATDITRTPVDPGHGYGVQVDFSASLVGTYAAALSKTVRHGKLPDELPLARISRWVHVTNPEALDTLIMG